MTTQEFTLLAHAELLAVVSDADLCEHYLDGLALIDDLLCEFATEPERQVQTEPAEIASGLRTLLSSLANQHGVHSNVEQNVTVAEELRDEAHRRRGTGEVVHALNLLIDRFRGDLLRQYTLVAQTY